MQPRNKGNRWRLRKFVKARPRSSEEKELVSMLPLDNQVSLSGFSSHHTIKDRLQLNDNTQAITPPLPFWFIFSSRGLLVLIDGPASIETQRDSIVG
jgi:hypothetical protein